MASHENNIAAIRRRLGRPLADAPDDPQLMELLLDQIANFSASLANTRNHWAVQKTRITTSAGQEDYQIPAGDFGRPFLVYTIDDTDTYHVRREIPMVLMQDADLRYTGSQQSGLVSGHSAVEVVFYRLPLNDSWMARFVPIPGGDSSYEIWFESVYNYGSPQDVVGLSAFHHLVRVQTALSALPHCAWRDISLTDTPKAWEMKIKALRDSLAYDESKYQKQFDSYRAQSSREGVSSKRPWGGEDYDNGVGAVGGMSSSWGF